METPRSLSFSSVESPEMGIEQYYQEVANGPKRTFNCLYPDCGKTFKFYSEIKRHLTVHSSKRHYHCSFPGCHKSFKRPDALTNHARVHSEEASFACFFKDCNAKFSNKSSLNIHLIKHGQKHFTCKFPGCNKSFATYEQVKKHEETYFLHSGKPAAKADNLSEFDMDFFKTETPYSWESETQFDEHIKSPISNNNSDSENFLDVLNKKFKVAESSEIVIQRNQEVSNKSCSSYLSLQELRNSNMSNDCLIGLLESFVKENEELKTQLRQTFDLLEALN